ncbi:MAG TPA: hypothetical protein VKT51_13090 [Candidatus Eremiobacteraceae bacterium]|nr:hypothetical protein [Candidatus Eremiobacteraceae bacterium]
MGRTFMVRLSILSLLGLLCACAASDPLDGFAFTPPAGWTALPPHEGSRLWTNPRNPGEEVLVTRPGDLAPGEDRTVSGKPVTICGGHPATLTVKIGSAFGQPARLESITAIWQNVRIMAAYIRPMSARANPNAEASLRSVCPRSI